MQRQQRDNYAKYASQFYPCHVRSGKHDEISLDDHEHSLSQCKRTFRTVSYLGNLRLVRIRQHQIRRNIVHIEAPAISTCPVHLLQITSCSCTEGIVSSCVSPSCRAPRSLCKFFINATNGAVVFPAYRLLDPRQCSCSSNFSCGRTLTNTFMPRPTYFVFCQIYEPCRLQVHALNGQQFC